MNKQVINEVNFADYDESTVLVTATANNEQETFHIQTVDGEYRSSMGCWIIAESEMGGDIDFDDYPQFDFKEIIEKAEVLAETLISGTENPEYFNKDQSPYAPRFLQDER